MALSVGLAGLADLGSRMHQGGAMSGLAKLVVIEGVELGEIFSLDGQVIFELGSGAGVDLRLEDPEIVSSHLKIYRENEHYHVFDLSGRGFLINGRRSLKHELTNGDVVTLGGHALRFESEPEADPADQLFSGAAAPITESGVAAPISTPLPANDSSQVKFQIIKGNDLGKSHDLQSKPMSIIGRGIATDITVWDIRVSRIHCRIDNRDNEFTLSDMNSSNGTWVNGARLTQSHRLKHGDHVKLGSTVMQFEQA